MSDAAEERTRAAGRRRAAERNGHSIRRFLAVVLVAAALAPAASEASRQDEAGASTLSWSGGDCPDINVRVPIEPRRARTLVPARFKLTQPVQAIVEVLECEELRLGGESIGPGHISLAAVSIESPEGRPPFPLSGGDYYLLWHLTDIPVLRAEAASAGLPGAVVPGICLRAGARTAEPATAEVPWPESPHSLGARPAPIRRPFDSLEFVFWHLGDGGLLRYVVKVSGTSSIGLGSVRATAGSPLAALLGSSVTFGIAAFSRLSFDVVF